jgi:uncharacterized membrane protein YgcG
MIIAWCIAIIFVLAIAGIIVHAFMKDRAKRKRLASAYDRGRGVVERTATEPLRRGQFVADAGEGRVRRARPREPETAADEWPATPTYSPELFNIPSPLDPLPSPSDWSAPYEPDSSPSPIEPGGGEFGGAGASGSWDDSPKGGD